MAVMAAVGFVAAAVVPGSVEGRFNRVSTIARLPSARAAEVHARLRVADLHADSLLWGRDLLERGSTGHADVPRLAAGNAAIQVFGVVTAVPNAKGRDRITALALVNRWPPRAIGSLLERALYQARRLARMQERSGGALAIVRTRADLARVLEARRGGGNVLGALLGLEGAHALEAKLGSVKRLDEAGFRMVGLAHFQDNSFAGSAHGKARHGLTENGRALVAELERRGILVDLAHSSPQTFADVIAMATRPVVVSHTGVTATCDSRRNLTDSQLRAVARNGGVVGIGVWPEAVCGSDTAAFARAVRHAVDVAGVRHVALGADLDGSISSPIDASRFAELTDALLAAGLGEETIRRVMGENTLDLLARTLP